MIVGCYTLDLYCDNEDAKDVHRYNEFPHIYLAGSGSMCRKMARVEGWKLIKGKALCPTCTGKSLDKVK